MKNIFKYSAGFALALLVALVATPASAQPSTGISDAALNGLAGHSTGGTVVGTTLYYGVISANGRNSGTPVITGISARSGAATAKIQFYGTTNSTSANFASTTTSIPVVSTNGFTSSDIIVIRHMIDDTYERRATTTFTSGTNLTVTVAPTVALAAGDQVFKMYTTGQLIWGAVTNTIQSPGIWYGQASKPLLFEIDSSAAADGQISASAVYR